ncbi:MAG: quinone oxidoreductase family protein [Acidobacteriaceae bacterium]
MKAAVVEDFSAPPRYRDFAPPDPKSGETLIQVNAAALSMLVRGQASGKHYSSEGVLPFIPGNDGVGRLPNGERVYFIQPRAPYGSMAELSVARQKLCIPVPEGVSDVTAAAIANPGMSSWAALTKRAKLAADETVFINGATGTAGRLAIQIAKHLGAKKVIATGRNAATLQMLPSLGADVVLSLDQPDNELVATFRREIKDGGVNIILDYLWGRTAECLIRAFADKGSPSGEPRVRFVQIGSVAGADIKLTAGILRSSGLEILGSGFGSLSTEALLASIGEMFASIVPANLQIDTQTAPLADVEEAWNHTTGDRLVFTLP